MIVDSVQYALSVTNPPNEVQAKPPARVGTFIGFRLANYSPFPAIVNGVGDDNNSQVVLPPYTQNVYAYNNQRGPIVLDYQSLNVSTVIPINMLAIVEWADDPADLHGSYPIALSRDTTITVNGPLDITGFAAAPNIFNAALNLPPSSGIAFLPAPAVGMAHYIHTVTMSNQGGAACTMTMNTTGGTFLKMRLLSDDSKVVNFDGFQVTGALNVGTSPGAIMDMTMTYRVDPIS